MTAEFPTVEAPRPNAIAAWVRGLFTRDPIPAPTWFRGGQAMEVEIPLSAAFRFAHEPVESSFRPPHFVGREADLDALVQRILFSDGGSFLVTGYRGVGKTSFVNQVIHRIRDVLPKLEPQIGRVEVVDVHLTLARSVSGAELMHHIIRRLHDRLHETGQWSHVPGPVQNELRLAYRRTSMNVTNKSTETQERQYGVSEASISRALVGAFKVMWTQKMTSAKADEATFLGYDDKAAENDVLRIARRLTAPPEKSWWRRAGPRRLKIVFVFDELDKMDDPAVSAGTLERPLDQILGSLKNLFTTSGICFLFVAGKDLHERWLEDLGRGDSIYESVFCFDKYLPCLWEKTEAICRCFVDERALTRRGSEVVNTFMRFERYLYYKGRGIPRRIIREFNQFVVWRGAQAVLAFSKQDVRRFRFYAELQELLETRWQKERDLSPDDASATRSDKERLGVLYLIDWILARGKNDFTADDAVNASHALSTKIAPAKEIAPAVIGDLLAFLVAHDYLVEVRSDVATVIQPVRKPTRYRLATRRIAELGQVPADVPELKDILVVRAPVSTGDATRFINMEKIGSGGMGDVYRAWDMRHGRFVALKMLAVTTDEAMWRFEREAALLASLRHPAIVQFYEFLRSEGEPARPAIVMEYVDGTSLRAILNSSARLEPATAVAILRQIARGVAYVHQNGIVRHDMKPDNVLVTRDGRLLMSDFGISKRVRAETAGAITRTGVVIGTPSYMAPEQALGAEVDGRVDIYALGAMLFEMITGQPPFGRVENATRYILRTVNESAPRCSELAEVSPLLDSVIARCLERDPTARYQTAEELLRDLEGVNSMSDVRLAEFLTATVGVSQKEQSKRNRATISQAISLQVTGFNPPAFDASNAVTPPTWRAETRAIDTGPVLRVVAPEILAGFEIAVKARLRIGRSDDADFRIDSPMVSRLHAEIVLERDALLEDMNSANGTWVNGERIHTRVPLHDGAEIRVGDVMMIFEASRPS